MPLHVLDAEEIAEREYELEMEERAEQSRKKDKKQQQLSQSMQGGEHFEMGWSV
jgi:hypothetical protein